MPDSPSPETPKTKPRFRPPDTMIREQWDAARADLPEKIDEIIASFREDRLSVHPRAVPENEDEAETEDWEEDPTTLLIAKPRRGARQRLLLLLAVLGLCVIAALLSYYYLDGGAPVVAPPVQNATPVVPIGQPNTAPIHEAGAPPDASALSITPQKPASPAPLVATEPEVIAAKPLPPALRPKARPRSTDTPPPKPAEAEVRTVEDLTPLIRGGKPE